MHPKNSSKLVNYNCFNAVICSETNKSVYTSAPSNPSSHFGGWEVPIPVALQSSLCRPWLASPFSHQLTSSPFHSPESALPSFTWSSVVSNLSRGLQGIQFPPPSPLSLTASFSRTSVPPFSSHVMGSCQIWMLQCESQNYKGTAQYCKWQKQKKKRKKKTPRNNDVYTSFSNVCFWADVPTSVL